MALTIRETLDKHFEGVKFDRDFCKRVIDYALRFMNRNEDHSAFFGGVLMGVQEVKFYDTDRELWFDDVLGVDDDLLQHDFLKAEGIDPTHNVASDVMNHTPGYITMRLMKETGIPLNVRHEAMVSAFMVLHFKYLTSLLVRRFKYLARREVAEATFMALNYKFDIKAIGSWGKLIRQRSEGIVEKGSIYTDFFEDRSNVDDEYWTKRVVTDTQSRIRELINKYYSVYIKTLESGSRIVTTSDTVISTDGEQVLRDKASGYATYLRYMHTVIQSRENFIRPELVGVIEKLMPTMPPQFFGPSLEFMVKNVNQPRSHFIEQFMDESLLYTFDFMQSIRGSVQRNNDLNQLMQKVRAKVTAPKSDDPRVMLIRTAGEEIVKNATTTKHPGHIAATRTGLLLYVILRAMTKNYYNR